VSKKQKTVFISDNEIAWISSNLWQFNGEYITCVEDLPDDMFEMAYCDKNGKIQPDRPKVIVYPGQKDFGDVIDLA
jgi:hypothetical protein